LLRRVRDQRQLARPHDRRPQLSLVQRAGPRNTPRQHLGALGHERHQELHILVVDVVDLVRAELADLAPPEHRPALPVLALLGGTAGFRAPSAETLPAVHRISSPPPMSKRSSRSSSGSPRWPSPGWRSGGNPRATRRRRAVCVRRSRVRATTACSSSTRTTRWRMMRSVTLRRRSISFIKSPSPLITAMTEVHSLWRPIS